eukprot:1209317-Prymnesium_polylepis.1
MSTWRPGWLPAARDGPGYLPQLQVLPRAEFGQHAVRRRAGAQPCARRGPCDRHVTPHVTAMWPP